MSQPPRPLALETSFSVVVPVHNGARFLRQALDSVAAQTLRAWDCTIVDDASSDESREIAGDWTLAQDGRSRLIRHAGFPRGVAETRNEGIRRAKSPWIAFLDQDDFWEPSKLEEQARFIEEHPDVAVVGCLPTVLLDGIDALPLINEWVAMIQSVAERHGSSLGLVNFVAACPFCLSGVVARRSELLDHRGFDTSLPRTSDWFMWARLASRAPLGLLAQQLVVYRLHGGNEMLQVAAAPLGLGGAFLEMRTRLVDWMMEDRGMRQDVAGAFVDGLVRQAAPGLRAAVMAARGRASI